jgi:hypothetical protein
MCSTSLARFSFVDLIILIAPVSQLPSVCALRLTWEKISHLCETTSEIIVIHILISASLYNRREDKIFWRNEAVLFQGKRVGSTVCWTWRSKCWRGDLIKTATLKTEFRGYYQSDCKVNTVEWSELDWARLEPVSSDSIPFQACWFIELLIPERWVSLFLRMFLVFAKTLYRLCNFQNSDDFELKRLRKRWWHINGSLWSDWKIYETGIGISWVLNRIANHWTVTLTSSYTNLLSGCLIF